MYQDTNRDGEGWGFLLATIGAILVVLSNFELSLDAYYYGNRCIGGGCQPFLNEYVFDIATSILLFTIGCVTLYRGVWLVQGRPRKFILAAEVTPFVTGVCLFTGYQFGYTPLGTLAAVAFIVGVVLILVIANQ